MINFKKKEILFLGCLLLVLPVFFRFVELQIIDHEKWKKKAGKNSLRQINLKASRGIIYDRDGIPLVDNMEKYSIELTPYDITSSEFNYDIIKEIIGFDKSYIDSKSLFQEKSQEILNITPHYKVLSESGPDHNKKFIVGVYINKELITKGKGYSKQEAQTEAAEEALKIKNWS